MYLITSKNNSSNIQYNVLVLVFPRFRVYFLLQPLQFLLVGAQKYFLSYANDKIIGVGLV